MFQSAVVNSKAKMLPPIPTILFRLYTLALFYINFFNHLMLVWFGWVVLTQPSGEVVWVIKQIPFHNGKIPQFQNPQRWLTASAVIAFQTVKKTSSWWGRMCFQTAGLWRLRIRGQPCWNKNLASCRDSFVKGTVRSSMCKSGSKCSPFSRGHVATFVADFLASEIAALIAESKFETFFVTQGICHKRSKWMNSLIWKGKRIEDGGWNAVDGQVSLEMFRTHIYLINLARLLMVKNIVCFLALVVYILSFRKAG